MCVCEGLTVLQRILDMASEKTWLVTSVNLDTLTEASFLKVMQDLENKKDYHVILDCELERLNSILNLVLFTRRKRRMVVVVKMTGRKTGRRRIRQAGRQIGRETERNRETGRQVID